MVHVFLAVTCKHVSSYLTKIKVCRITSSVFLMLTALKTFRFTANKLQMGLILCGDFR